MRTLLIVMLLAGTGWGQVSAQAEAQKKLADRQAQRVAERAKTVEITAGELEDLRNELALMRAQNTALQKKIADLQGGSTKRRVFKTIEIGMTKQELIDFVKVRPREMRIVAVQLGGGEPDTGAAQTIRVTKTSTGDAAETPKVAVVEESIRHSNATKKKEHVKIEFLAGKSVVVGQTRDFRGTLHDQTQTQYVPTGYANVEIINDVVSSIEARR